MFYCLVVTTIQADTQLVTKHGKIMHPNDNTISMLPHIKIVKEKVQCSTKYKYKMSHHLLKKVAGLNTQQLNHDTWARQEGREFTVLVLLLHEYQLSSYPLKNTLTTAAQVYFPGLFSECSMPALSVSSSMKGMSRPSKFPLIFFPWSWGTSDTAGASDMADAEGCEGMSWSGTGSMSGGGWVRGNGGGSSIPAIFCLTLLARCGGLGGQAGFRLFSSCVAGHFPFY